MTIDLDTLEALAKAATPGPWKNVDTPAMYIRDEIRGANGARIGMALTTRHPREGEQFIDFDQAEANAAFIAAANPAVVLELIAELRKGRAERYWLATRIALDGVSCPVEPNVCAATCADHIQCWLKAASDAVGGKK